MRLFIRSSACISPQKTLGYVDFLTDIVEYNGTRLKAIEPEYKDYVDPKLIRRMSHVIKMGVAAAKVCLKMGGLKMPGAVVTGTAMGCMEDTATFMTRLIEQQEELLPPTSFIQSTHNTVGAQVALMLQCHNYNNTFVHKGISFESALLDAAMLLNEEDAATVLVGGIEEMTDTTFAVLTRLDLFKRWPVSNLSLLSTISRGTIGGEGAVFFLLSPKESEENLAEFIGVRTCYKPISTIQFIIDFLTSHSLSMDDIDLVVTGKNGDTKNDAIYNDFNQTLCQNKAISNYKHLCGEYATSSSFALWMAANMISKQTIPEITVERPLASGSPKKILIYNHYLGTYHSLMLVSAV